MDPAVAALAKGDQIAVLVCSALSERNNVMDLFHRNEASFLEAKLTEGMAFDVGITDDLPVLSVPALCGLTVTTVLFITRVHFLLVLLAVPTVCQARAPWVRTRFLWFVWHNCLLFCITKAPVDYSIRAQSFILWYTWCTLSYKFYRQSRRSRRIMFIMSE